MTIGFPYTMTFTDPSVPDKKSFTINPNETDGPLSPIENSPDSTAKAIHTSLVFPGMGLIQYGERVNESLLHVLENFSSCTPPVAPTSGQEWYDFCNKLMKVWNGTSWDPVGGTGFPIASTAEYNLLIQDINKVLGDPIPGIPGSEDTVWGYGQQTLPVLTTPPTDNDWIKLVQAVRKIGLHQGTNVATLVDGGFTIPPYGATIGIVGLMARFVDLQTKVTAIKVNRQLIDINTLISSSNVGGHSTRTTPWISSLRHTVLVQFASNAHMQSYFNTGGGLSVSALLDNNTTPQNARWQTQLQEIGSVQLTAFYTRATTGNTHYGLYNLSSTPQQIYSHNVGGASGNTYVVEASVDTTQFTITLSMSFADYSIASDGSNESVSGNITSSVTAIKAGPTYIGNPEIAFPTMTTLVPLTIGGSVVTPGKAATCAEVSGIGSITIPAGSTLVTGYSTGGDGSNGPGAATTATFQSATTTWLGSLAGNPNAPAATLQVISNNVAANTTLEYNVVAGKTMQLCYTGPLHPPAGTILATHCVGVNKYNTVADGNGGSTEVLLQSNSASCGYVPPTNPPAGTILQEFCTGSDRFHTVADGNGGATTILFQSNSPECCPAAGTVINGSACIGNDKYQVIANGNCTTRNVLVQTNSPSCCPMQGTVVGQTCVGADLYNLIADGNCGSTQVLLTANSPTCNNCPASGTVLNTHCVGNNQYNTVADGNCSTTEVLVESNSPSCCPASGTVLATHCVGADKYNTVANGTCGTTEVLVEVNSATCGYVAYPPAGTVLNDHCVGVDRYHTVADGNGGSSEVLVTPNDPTCGATPASIFSPDLARADGLKGVPNYYTDFVDPNNGNIVTCGDGNYPNTIIGFGSSGGWYVSGRSGAVIGNIASGIFLTPGHSASDVDFMVSKLGAAHLHTDPGLQFGAWYQMDAINGGNFSAYDGSAVITFRARNNPSDTVSVWLPYGPDIMTGYPACPRQAMSCFPAGSMVTMADGTSKAIEAVSVGDLVMGPLGAVTIEAMDRPILGNRKMKTFADSSLFWSDEHSMWTKLDDKQWWWSADAQRWRAEAESGHIGGLLDNSTMRSGTDGISWAHLDGWKVSAVLDAEGYTPNTSLYLPRTNGSPIIVNGYVVGAGVNEKAFDYTKIDWDVNRLDIVSKLS